MRYMAPDFDWTLCGRLADMLGLTWAGPSTIGDLVMSGEAEMERRGLAERYTSELLDLLDAWPVLKVGHQPDYADYLECFKIATAPADVRVRAMLAALGVAVEHR